MEVAHFALRFRTRLNALELETANGTPEAILQSALHRRLALRDRCALALSKNSIAMLLTLNTDLAQRARGINLRNRAKALNARTLPARWNATPSARMDVHITQRQRRARGRVTSPKIATISARPSAPSARKDFAKFSGVLRQRVRRTAQELQLKKKCARGTKSRQRAPTTATAVDRLAFVLRGVLSKKDILARADIFP